jgi:hypothetical protein
MPVYTMAGGIVNHKLIVALVVVIVAICRGLFLGIYLYT